MLTDGMRVGQPGWLSYIRMVSKRVMEVMEADNSLPCHGIACTRQDCGKLFDQVWPIAGLFQLLDDTDHDVIVYTLCVDFVVCGSTW